jgi:hypothetical protein
MWNAMFSALQYTIVIIIRGIKGSLIILVYEHHYTFMVTMVDPNTDDLGEDNESAHPSRAPVQTPGSNQKLLMEMEEELYEEYKLLRTV